MWKPVVFNPEKDALLEIAAVILTMDEDGWLKRAETHVQQIDPFEGANLEQSALDFTGIDPWNPEREAVPEREGMSEIFGPIRKAVKAHDCKRAVLVGHNATFDHNFVFAAALRSDIRRNPFHPFFNLRTRQRWRAWPTAIPYWRKPVSWRAFRSATRKLTRPPMTPRKPPICSVASSIAGAKSVASHHRQYRTTPKRHLDRQPQKTPHEAGFFDLHGQYYYQ